MESSSNEDNDKDAIENIKSTPLFIPTDPEDPIASSSTPAPANVAQWKFHKLQTNLDKAIKETLTTRAFAKHVAQVEQGRGGLFPENARHYSRAPSKILNPPTNPQVSATPTPYQNDSTEWFKILTESINRLEEEQYKVQNLVVHSIAQNNIMGSVNATVISNLKDCIVALEERLALQGEGNTTENSGHQSPLSFLSSQKEKLDMIARKVTSLDHKISSAAPSAPGNLPGLQNKNQKTEGQGAKQKGTEAKEHWYNKDLNNFSTERLGLWAAAISTGKWGRRINDQAEPFNFKQITDRKTVQAYINRAIQFHFKPRGTNNFPYAPPAELKVRSGWTKKFEWQIINHEGNVVKTARTPLYPPNWIAPLQLEHTFTEESKCSKNKGKQRAVKTTGSFFTTNIFEPTPDVEDPWTETPKGGSTSRGPSKPKQFSFATAAASKPRITAPQPKYDNVLTARFMAPMPKAPVKRTGNYGKKYMLKFNKNEKPAKGAALPIQAVVSKINCTCSQFNIKANSADWTPAMNLIIFFTHNSIDPQIEKARNTILSILAKGTAKTLFFKLTKWSRIVIRDIPTQKWIADEDAIVDEDTGMLPGKYVPVTDAELEAEIRKSSTVLENTMFIEGPTWTNHDGIPTKPRGNVSFCIPDPDEAYLQTLICKPILLFHAPCFCTKWIEKINLIQCTRCWKFGNKVHPDCPIRCRRCGGGHEERDHHVACKKCEKSDINQEDRKRGLTICDHPTTCPNCNGNHHADDSSCKMRNHTACEERQRRKIGRGQTFISDYAENFNNARMRIDNNLS